MLPVLVGAVLGAVLMGRTKPKTRAVKKQVLGARSGVSYEVEDFEAAGFVVVVAPDGSRGVFRRRPARSVRPGQCAYEWHDGTGEPTTLHAMFEDVCGPRPEKPKEKSET